MKVTQTEPRDQRKSFAKYKQTLGKADPIVVRRALTFPHAVTHPNSKATARQRARLSTASKYESSISFADISLIRSAARLSFTSKPSGKGTAKILTGRQAIVSQAIRDQQTGHIIQNYGYPCLVTSDIVGNVFDMDTAYMFPDKDRDNKIWGKKLNATEFLFPAIPRTAKDFNVITSPRKAFVYRNYYPGIPAAEILSGGTQLKPTIIIELRKKYSFCYSRSRYPETLFTKLTNPPGMIVYIRKFYGFITWRMVQWMSSVVLKIEYLTPTLWRYTMLSSYFPPGFDNWTSYRLLIWHDNDIDQNYFYTKHDFDTYQVELQMQPSQGEL